MLQFFKKPIVIILIFTLIGGGGWFLFTTLQNDASVYEFFSVQKRDLIQEVSVTGTVKPVQEVELAFEKGGRISNIYVQIETKVTKYQLLLELDNADLNAELAQAEASVVSANAQLKQYQAALEVEQAKLAELKKGTRLEEINSAEIKVLNSKKAIVDTKINVTNVKAKAEIDFANLYNDVSNILHDAYVKADDAINNQIDILFTNDTSDDPQLSFRVTDSQVKADVGSKRAQAGTELNNFKSEVDSLSSDYGELDTSLVNAKNHLLFMRSFLARVLDALNAEANLSDANVNTYKGYVNTGRTNINTAISNITDQINNIAAQKITNTNNISSAESSLTDNESTLANAKSDLVLKKAGATSEQIAAQEAQVKKADANIVGQSAKIKEAEANVQKDKAQIEKTVLRAPFDSVVTRQEAKIGEIVAANISLISLISESRFEIEADVPEADITKIALEYPVSIMLDAFGIDKQFSGIVMFIEPSELIIQDVVYYQIKVSLDQKDVAVKPGMTADINIITAERKNVIAVPIRTVRINKDGSKSVRVLKNNVIQTKPVTTGIRSNDGYIEIFSGLSEGEEIIIRELEK